MELEPGLWGEQRLKERRFERAQSSAGGRSESMIFQEGALNRL